MTRGTVVEHAARTPTRAHSRSAEPGRRRWRVELCLLPLALTSGCYLSHGTPEAPVELDAGRPGARDAARPRPRDAGTPRPDARPPRRDASVVLPPEPEPDPGPDERPTGPWDGGVTPPPPGEPVLEPSTEPVVLDDETDSGGPPALVWNGGGWGVAWPGTFRTLDQDGRPTSPRARLDRAGWGLGLDFAAGHYAVAVGGAGSGSELSVAAFDRDAARVAGWGAGARGAYPDVARLQLGHQWVVAAIDQTGGEYDRVIAFAMNGAMSLASDTLVLATDSHGDARVAGSKSRAVVVWTTASAVRAQSLTGPELQRDGEPFTVLEIPQQPDSGLEIEPFRDQMAVAAMDGVGVYLALLDPWLHEVTGPFRVGSSRIGDRRPGIAVAEEEGFLVVCYAVGRGPYGGGGGSMDGVTLQVVGADGALWGPPLPLVTGERNVGGVDCGWNGREIVVVWWRAAGDGAWNTIFSQRARPTFL